MNNKIRGEMGGLCWWCLLLMVYLPGITGSVFLLIHFNFTGKKNRAEMH